MLATPAAAGRAVLAVTGLIAAGNNSSRQTQKKIKETQDDMDEPNQSPEQMAAHQAQLAQQQALLNEINGVMLKVKKKQGEANENSEEAKKSKKKSDKSCKKDCLDWDNVDSGPTWGHTFTRHGQGSKNSKKLLGRTQQKGPQGQWQDNQKAAELLKNTRKDIKTKPGEQAQPQKLPEDVPGQVIFSDGTTKPATHFIGVPSRTGGYRTAYPMIP